jgi:superfamily I DNA/RNA helicase
MSGQLDLFDMMPAQDITPLYLQGLNEQQQDAVMTPADEALQVLAGAGTGKTELISRRFVKLVKDFRAANVLRPEERILVVTFTSDAALSMRARIHQRLVDNGEEGLGPDAWISTFHQFCMRLLRAHPLEVGLPPDFSTLNSLQQQVLFNRVVHGVLAGDYPEIANALEKFELNALLPSQILSLNSLQQCGLEDVEAFLEPGRIYKLVSRIKTAGLSPREFFEVARLQSRRLTERLESMPLPHDQDLKSVENVQLKVDAWRDSLRGWAHADWDPVREAERKADATGKKVTASTYKDELPGLARLYLASRTFEPVFPNFEILDEVLALEENVIGIVAAIYALYQDALLAQGACDFDDLINHSIALLSRHLHLQNRYQQKFEAIIVDEFQDSNGSQLRLLELLMREGAKNLTVVGDEKQSIYGFRFAQPENLDLIFRHGPYKKVNLQTNYRSRPPVLAVANYLTRQITTRPNQQLLASAHNAAFQEPKATWLNLDAVLEDDSGKQYNPSVYEQKQLEAHYIAVEIARLIQAGACKFSDIAILVKSHAKAEEIQRMLATLNIPSIRQKNLGFFQEPSIKDAMALLRLMHTISDELSLVRILQNKLNQRQLRELVLLKQSLTKQMEESGQTVTLFETCLRLNIQPELLPSFPAYLSEAVADLANQLLEIRKQKSRMTPVQLFLRLAKAVGLIDPELPEWQKKQQRIALRTFEKMLYLFSQSKPLQPTLDEVIETLEQYAADPNQELPVSEELSGEDAVRIMTVFASKGLEFPVVFVAYTEKARSHAVGEDSAVLFDPQYAGKNGFGLILGKVNGYANLKREIYQKCWLAPRGKTEAQRVFYVALTRAQERLYVIRGSQSHDWTSPEGYPRDAMQVLSEADDAEQLDETIWQVDQEALRQAMAALQEQQVPV